MNTETLIMKLPKEVKEMAEQKSSALGLSVAAFLRMLIIKA